MSDIWFEADEGELTPTQAILVEVVRESVCTWPQCPPDATAVLVFSSDEYVESGTGRHDWTELHEAAVEAAFSAGHSVLMLIVDVLDSERKRIVKTLGATVAGNRVFCSERHGSTYQPQVDEDVVQVSVTGTPEELGRIIGDWIRDIVLRPVAGPDSGPGAYSFVAPGTPLHPGHRWVRNGPALR